MVQTSYPGVYIQEKASGVRTITGVATSIAGFFGRSSLGPLNKAVRCLSFADFIRGFASPYPDNDLATSVQQFFNNGGTDCYVVRLASATVRRSVTLRAWDHTDVLRAIAKYEGTRGDAHAPHGAPVLSRCQTGRRPAQKRDLDRPSLQGEESRRHPHALPVAPDRPLPTPLELVLRCPSIADGPEPQVNRH